MQLKNILLKSIPYILSIIGGIFVFDFSQKYLHSESWIDLMNNVAASLLSIPLVFLFYDYSNYLVTRKVNKHLHVVVIHQLNNSILIIVNYIKDIVGIKKLEIPIQDLSLHYTKLNMNRKYIDEIKKQLNILEDVLYKSDKIQVLDIQYTQILSFIIQELTQIINEFKYKESNKEIAKHLETVLSTINDWFITIGYIHQNQHKLHYR